MAETARNRSRIGNSEIRTDTLPGVISVHELYTIGEAKARLGWTDSALRAAKRRGLNLITCGKRRYVTGREICRFLESLSPGLTD